MTTEASNQSELAVSIDYSNPTTSCPFEHVQQQIRKRAYELFEKRGREPGFETADWISAERQIKHHLGQA